MTKRLVIVGAGPKAAALVARAAVLGKMLGRGHVPELLVFERDHIASAWSGRANHSNGFVTLCTPGEKDVGFPYDEAMPRGARPPLAPLLYARFSWGAYLAATGRIMNWVERERDHPTHARFADYIHWVFKQAKCKPKKASVTGISHHAGKWHVTYRTARGGGFVQADGVVITGAGTPRTVEVDADVPPRLVLDAETFWPARETLAASKAHLQVAVAGDGGAAGTIVAWLADRFRETDNDIWSISPTGTLFPRGDGYAERRWFSDPADWPQLSVEHRHNLIKRTEAGVVSLRNKRTIDRSERIEYKTGLVETVGYDPVERKLRLGLRYETTREPLTADVLVNAIGFDPWSRLTLVDHPRVNALARPPAPVSREVLDKERFLVERAIRGDLALPVSAGVPAGLHVPGLAGIAQGPGFGNLGCLGLMARKILDRYIV